MERFDEYSDKGREIARLFEGCLTSWQRAFKISYFDPPHDIARRFLNEIVEFEPLDEGGDKG